MNLPDDLDQPQIRALTPGHRTVSPVVEATCRHAQHPACHRDRDPVRGELPHYRVDHFGRTFSRAAGIDVGLRHPVTQTRLIDPQTLGDLTDRTAPNSGQLDRALPELRWKRCGHNDILPRRPFRLKVGVRRTGGRSIVVWHTFGATHVPRPEDWPVMPVERCGFRLHPVGVFGRNPTPDVPIKATCH